MNIFDLEPKSVMKFFYEINQIPRGSGNEKAISDYLVGFAKERGLEVIQDEALNVLIRKSATKGYESHKGVIIQGHMDMVCSKNAGVEHDFEKDPIDMMIDGDYITANGTTLGADNGIAVAMGLALIDANDLQHPEIELIITTDEEVGLNGAIAFDASQLNGGYYLNLDSEEEGEFTIGCAGGLKAIVKLPIYKEKMDTSHLICKEVSITKLNGGHSGVDIDRYRANAIKLTGRILCKLDEELEFSLLDIYGGDKDNVIPRETFFTLAFAKEEESQFDNLLDAISIKIQNEFQATDPNIEIVSKTIDVDSTIEVLAESALETLIFLLMTVPNGIQTMSPELEGFVESSLNIGKVAVEDDHIIFLFAVRSSIASLKEYITNQLKCYADYCNAEFIKTAEYPEWPVKNNTQLLEKAIEVYKTMYKKEPIVKSIHAGLEGGVFMEKLPHLEAISLGPDMDGVHSPDERISISSIQRTYDYLIKLIEAL